jgi:type I restriction enzyme M protein
VDGVIASWWNEVQYELKSVESQGFEGLVDGWVTTIRAALEDTDTKRNAAKFNPLDYKLTARLIPEYLEELAAVQSAIAELEQEKEAFERGEDVENGGGDSEPDDDEEVPANYAKELESRLRELKNSIKEPLQRIKHLSRGPGVKDKGSIAAQKKLGNDTTTLEAELEELAEQVVPVQGKIEELERELQPYKEIKSRLTEAKKTLKGLNADLVERLEQARGELKVEQSQQLVLDILKDDLSAQLEHYVSAHRQQVVAAVENWWDKYYEPLSKIEQQRDVATKKLGELMSELGYDI